VVSKILNGKPGVVVVLDTIVDDNAVREAKHTWRASGGVVDTNANPANIDYVIPGNDDAIKGLQLHARLFCRSSA
jgi:small subunit ribosomal protein S2